jgi:hypothetical protein
MRQQIRVFLSKEEVRLACTGGIEHRIDAMFKHQRPGASDRPYHLQHWWQSHITGSLGEVAVAKLFGVDWQWQENENGFDVLEYQVRTTENAENTIKVRRRDDPTHNFIHCKVRDNRVLIEGWITGQEVINNNEEIYKDCFTIKDYRLYSMTDLPEFPQELPEGVQLFKPPAKRLGTIG